MGRGPNSRNASCAVGLRTTVTMPSTFKSEWRGLQRCYLAPLEKCLLMENKVARTQSRLQTMGHQRRLPCVPVPENWSDSELTGKHVGEELKAC